LEDDERFFVLLFAVVFLVLVLPLAVDLDLDLLLDLVLALDLDLDLDLVALLDRFLFATALVFFFARLVAPALDFAVTALRFRFRVDGKPLSQHDVVVVEDRSKKKCA
jgi:hypothetical protein